MRGGLTGGVRDAGLALCMYIQLKFLNNGMRHFDVLFVLPIYQAFWITGAVSLPTANCIIIDHFSAFEFELVALFLTLPLKNGWQWVKTARNLNLGVSRNRFCDFLADPDSRSFSRFGAIIMQFAVVMPQQEYFWSAAACACRQVQAGAAGR